MTEITLPDEVLEPKPDLEFTLPNGVKVKMWEPDGIILEKATQMSSRIKSDSPSIVAYTLIALSCTFDDKRIRYEDIRRMKMRNLTVLMKKFSEVNGNIVGPLTEKPEDQSE